LALFVKWMDATDGRDKAGKVVQYLARLAAYLVQNQDKNLAQKCSNLMGAVRDGRKLFHFGKGVADYQRIVSVLESKQPPLIKALTVVCRIGFLNYWTFDHINYLAKFKVLALDPAPYARYSARGWFVGILFFMILESINYLEILAAQKKIASDPSKLREYNALRNQQFQSQLALARNFGDLIVSASAANVPEVLFRRSVNEGVISLAGIIAGLIACYTNIKAAAKP